MASSSAEPLLNRLEDGGQDFEDTDDSLDSGAYNEKPHSGRSNIGRKRYIAIAAILLFLFAFGIFSFVFVSSSNASHSEVVPEDVVPVKETEVEPEEPSFPSQLIGPPTESFWGELHTAYIYLHLLTSLFNPR